jgi:dynein intermediate chain 2
MQGRLVAVGDQDGVVTVIELCDSLNYLQPKEKEVITEVIY